MVWREIVSLIFIGILTVIERVAICRVIINRMFVRKMILKIATLTTIVRINKTIQLITKIKMIH
jgi:hypothetical protein